MAGNLTVKCPGCGQRLLYGPELVGRIGKCKGCRRKVTLPAPGEPGCIAQPTSSTRKPAVQKAAAKEEPVAPFIIERPAAAPAPSKLNKTRGSHGVIAIASAAAFAGLVLLVAALGLVASQRARIAELEEDKAFLGAVAEHLDRKERSRDVRVAREAMRSRLANFGLAEYADRVLEAMKDMAGDGDEKELVFNAVLDNSRGMEVERQLEVMRWCLLRWEFSGRDQQEFSRLAAITAALNGSLGPEEAVRRALKLWQTFHRATGSPPSEQFFEAIRMWTGNGAPIEELYKSAEDKAAKGEDPNGVYQEALWGYDRTHRPRYSDR